VTLTQQQQQQQQQVYTFSCVDLVISNKFKVRSNPFFLVSTTRRRNRLIFFVVNNNKKKEGPDWAQPVI
jgi:hypothetical protein